VIKRVSMVQIAKETQKMTDGQINNHISRNYSIN
jgi:hypothetical protein